jgi:hypothetical protein
VDQRQASECFAIDVYRSIHSHLDAFCQLHNSLAGGISEQVGIAADGAALPVGPVTPDLALKPDAALDPTEPVEP